MIRYHTKIKMLRITGLHLEMNVMGKYEIGSKMRINMNAFLHSEKSKAFLTIQKIFRNRFI